MPIEKALQLLDIQKSALSAENQESLAFVIVNRPHILLRYDQAIFWTGPVHKPRLKLASGNLTLDEKSSYAQEIQKEISDTAKIDGEKISNLGDGKHLMHFETPQEKNLGGLWLERKTPLNESELAIAEELRIIFSYALALQSRRSPAGFFQNLKNKKRAQKFFWLAVILIALFPVRLTITAPMEVVSRNPFIISAPYDGIIEDVMVSPGETVRKEQALVLMEQNDLKAQSEQALQDLEIAKVRLSRLRREALSAPEKKAELEKLKSEILLKELENDYATEKLERSQLTAPQAGTAVFSDKDALIGKPVSAGTEILQIADPSEAELLIRVPVDSMLPIGKEAPVRFYLNAAPLDGHDAQIKSIGYQASADPDGLLTYKLRAGFAKDTGARIGWQGTVHIYGDWSVLIYSIMRRPLISLRKMAGL